MTELTPLSEWFGDKAQRRSTGSNDGFVWDSPVRSGFMDLDELLDGGYKRGDLVVVGSETGVGKTALLLNLARNAAIGQHATVALFSLAARGKQLAMRMLSAEADVEVARLRLGRHTEQEESRVMRAHGLLSGAAIYVNDENQLSVPDISAMCGRLRRAEGLDLVVIDYLQMLHGSVDGFERDEELAEISRHLKELARELDVPVIVAVPLSITRWPHIPMLSDLRECGSIEQDADLVIFIYRGDLYGTAEGWQNQHPDVPAGASPKNLAQIIVAKHRNGPTGTTTVRFVDRAASFQDLLLRPEPGFGGFE